MPEWVVPLLTAIGGAIVALVGREIIEWYERPRLRLDFEEREGQYPYTQDFNDEKVSMAGYNCRAKYFRLKVRNEGKKPALNCIAKLEIILTDLQNTPNKVSLHWSCNDPALFTKDGDISLGLIENADKIFAPIDLNVEDEEIVDVLMLSYMTPAIPNTNNTPEPNPFMESVSLRQIQLPSEWAYSGKVTIYAKNTRPESFKFNVTWDGTVEGFNKAFTKG
jgi:hypothetical protein